MKNIIACRPDFYALPLAEAAAELKRAGIYNLELGLPGDDCYGPLAETAEKLGMNISSFSSGLKVGNRESFDKLRRAVEAAGEYEVGVIFVSVSLPEGTPFEIGISELRELGAIAAEARTVLSIETHKPYGHNATVALETMKAVDSPGVGYNYDTANIFFYNPKGTDGIAELQKIADYVTSVHLKESKGEPGSFDFPVFGTGIVQFGEIFKILNDRGFYGPFTMELEGPVVKGLTPEEQTASVTACLDYLRSIGAA